MAAGRVFGYLLAQVMSASAKPRLAGRQPSYRGGVPRVKTGPVAPCDGQARAPRRGPPDRRGGTDDSRHRPHQHDPTLAEPPPRKPLPRTHIPTVARVRRCASRSSPVRPIGYANLDHAASAPCLDAVRTKVDEFLPWYASVHRGAGFASQVSTKLYERTRDVLRRFVDARRTDTVVFTRNTTDSFNLLARSLPAAHHGGRVRHRAPRRAASVAGPERPPDPDPAHAPRRSVRCGRSARGFPAGTAIGRRHRSVQCDR